MKHLLRAAVLCMWATGAMAHSPLLATSPEDQVTLAQMPAQVSMTFKGDIRLTRVTLSHANAKGVQIDLSNHKAFAQEFALPLEGMGAGVYTIEWRGLGTDGHVLNGSFSFTVE